MKTDFKLVGLQRTNMLNDISATLELNNSKQQTFYAPVVADLERKEAMWNYCENNWDDEKIAEVEHDGLNSVGVPINPRVISISHAN